MHVAIARRAHGRETCHDLRERSRVAPALVKLVRVPADRDRALHLELARRSAALSLPVRFAAVGLPAAHRCQNGYARESRDRGGQGTLVPTPESGHEDGGAER
jgi:hypothetical protein